MCVSVGVDFRINPQTKFIVFNFDMIIIATHTIISFGYKRTKSNVLKVHHFDRLYITVGFHTDSAVWSYLRA